jgi:hypothetical protein
MNFLMSLPRGFLVAVALVLGLIFIILSSPPHTPCDSQLEIFHESQKTRLFSQEIKGVKEAPRLITFEKTCKIANSPGGCYELMMALHRIMASAVDIPVECADKLMAVDEFKSALDRNLTLLVRLAWGSKPPDSAFERAGWLEPPDLTLFCQMADIKAKYDSSEKWEQLRTQIFGQVMKELPGAEALGQNEAWKRSILSVDCRTLL